MQQELNQFERNKVWKLVPIPNDRAVIGTKWVFGNKMDAVDMVIRNKTILVAKGYSRKEWIDFDKTFDLITRLKEIRIFLSYGTHENFNVYQINFKSAFLNRELEEEVYVQQRFIFEDFIFMIFCTSCSRHYMD